MRTKGISAELIAEKIKDVFSEKGFAFFDGGKPFNVNIIGIRNKSREVDEFDDHIMVLYRDESGVMFCDSYVATTDPGKKYLRRPINVDGAAILVPGQYRGVYHIGMHRGKYEALCQRGATVKVYRDDNRDDILDHEASEIDEGWYGINIHRAHPIREMERVNGYSAGCQVFASPTDFNEFMQTIRRSQKEFGDSFTYTLIDEADLGLDMSVA